MVFDRDFSNTNVRFNAAESIVSDGYEHGPVFVYISNLEQQQ